MLNRIVAEFAREWVSRGEKWCRHACVCVCVSVCKRVCRVVLLIAFYLTSIKWHENGEFQLEEEKDCQDVPHSDALVETYIGLQSRCESNNRNEWTARFSEKRKKNAKKWTEERKKKKDVIKSVLMLINWIINNVLRSTACLLSWPCGLTEHVCVCVCMAFGFMRIANWMTWSTGTTVPAINDSHNWRHAKDGHRWCGRWKQ